MLAGWFIDIVVEYLFRTIMRMIKRRGSRSWPIAKATVTSSAFQPASYGCDIAEVCYAYCVESELYTDINKKPFMSDHWAKDYVDYFRPDTGLTVRVKPGDPSVSIVREDDQTWTDHSTMSVTGSRFLPAS
jgi:hypothetical protein